MPKTTRDALKEAFKNGKKPDQNDFENVFDSLVHEDDPIDTLVPRATQQEAVEGLDNEKVITPFTLYYAIIKLVRLSELVTLNEEVQEVVNVAYESLHTLINNTISDFDSKFEGESDGKKQVDWARIVSKPASFTPSSHNHDDRYYTETEIDEKLDKTIINDSDNLAIVVNKDIILTYGNTTEDDYDNTDQTFNPIDRIQIRRKNENNMWGVQIHESIGFSNYQLSSRLQFSHSTDYGANWSNVAYIDTGQYDPNALLNFTGQHRVEPEEGNELGTNDVNEYVGLIVVSTGVYRNMTLMEDDEPKINEALPRVRLAARSNDKSVFGVLSDREDDEEFREYALGRFVSIFPKEDSPRLIVNSVGEGGMWVTNYNGALENGDYITSSDIPGLGMRQDDDVLHNYTVAKITQDCAFDDPEYYLEIEHEGVTYRKQFVGVTYHCG